MKSFILFLFLPVNSLFFGQIISKEDSVNAQRENEMQIRLNEILTYQKEQCTKDSLIAVRDAKTVNKYFISNIAPNGSDFPANKQLEAYLEKLGVVWGGTWMGNCTGRYSANSCYYHYMNEFTEQKFGKETIQNIIRKSILDYIEKHPSILFEYNDHLDWLYENNEVAANQLINQLFYKKHKSPKGYQRSQNKDSFTTVYLFYDDESHRLKLDHFTHQTSDMNAHKFIPYFERKITEFINSPIFVLSENARRHKGMKTSFIIYYQ
ncbi:hypothetical protein MKJ01_17910 [Chryseobacterium sp. SSA4.19]|uniref:hypothetical protein n=1 Tax=Chryseobacterium sp. SSA4.19 TaxID=2919915 RepID=UPI001F4E5F4A|nr:hypothetical protein [Chryseobacterium sp. SSA4.19]MCJ8155636.1 hypothetical protein [Chryseobacterium sp. SSA4.19]